MWIDHVMAHFDPGRRIKRSNALAWLLTLLFSGAATAGLFSSSVSDADMAGIKKLVVYSMLGDTFHKIDVSMFRFGRHGDFEVSVPAWGIDRAASEQAIAGLRAQHRFIADMLSGIDPALTQRSDLSRSVRRTLLERAKQQGADALLVFVGEDNAHDSAIVSGVGLRTHIEGKRALDQCLYVSFAAYVIQVDTGHTIAQAHPDPCLTTATIAFDPKPTWDEMSSDEKSGIEDAIKHEISERVGALLVSMKLAPRN